MSNDCTAPILLALGILLNWLQRQKTYRGYTYTKCISPYIDCVGPSTADYMELQLTVAVAFCSARCHQYASQSAIASQHLQLVSAV